jgi:hypothetical protein
MVARCLVELETGLAEIRRSPADGGSIRVEDRMSRA